MAQYIYSACLSGPEAAGKLINIPACFFLGEGCAALWQVLFCLTKLPFCVHVFSF
jgi:hypothetical protein